MRNNPQTVKLKQGFITQDYHGEQLMVQAGNARGTFHGLVRSNETAAFIVNCLKQETSEAEIVEALTETYEVDEERASADVRRILDKLRGIGAIEE